MTNFSFVVFFLGKENETKVKETRLWFSNLLVYKEEITRIQALILKKSSLIFNQELLFPKLAFVN